MNEEQGEWRELRRAELVREIRLGLDQLDRGESTDCHNEADSRAFFDGIKARGRAWFKAQQKSPTE